MVFAVISIDCTKDLKAKMIKVSGPEDLSTHLLKVVRDVSPTAGYLKDGNCLTCSGGSVDSYLILGYVEDAGYALTHVSTDREKTIYVFNKKD